jgi:hypothetical protein
LKEWDSHPEGWLEEQYTKHNEHVIATIPSDQLLVFNVKFGWEPLCDFLDKDIPLKKFPHVQVNTTKKLGDVERCLLIVVWLWIPVTVLLLITLLWDYVFPTKRRNLQQHLKED